MGGEWAADARRITNVLSKRCATDGLEINPEKPPVVACGRPQRLSGGRPPGTCRCLGCVHDWGKTWRGGYSIQRQTEGKRLRRTLGGFWRWCRDHRHRPLQEPDALLCAKRRGYYQDDGMRCHSRCLDLVYDTAVRAWRSWLHCRGGRKMRWRAFGRMIAAYARPGPTIGQGGVSGRADSLEHGSIGSSRAGVRAEREDAGGLSRRTPLPYGNVRHRGTV
jgi:hypothetical protein